MYGELPPRLRIAVARQRQEPALDQLQLLPLSLTPKQRLLAQKALAAASAPALLQVGQLLSEAAYAEGKEEEGWWGVPAPPKCGPFCYLLDEGASCGKGVLFSELVCMRAGGQVPLLRRQALARGQRAQLAGERSSTAWHGVQPTPITACPMQVLRMVAATRVAPACTSNGLSTC